MCNELFCEFIDFLLNSVSQIRISNLPDKIIYRSHKEPPSF